MNKFLTAIHRRLREQPDTAFCQFVIGGHARAISRGDLAARVGGFAETYRARGIAPRGIVAILLRHDPALHASYLAAMISGRVPAFLPCPSPQQDPTIYWGALRPTLARLDAAAFVLDRATLLEMRAAGLAVDNAISLDEVKSSGELPGDDIDEDAVALLQHSSGTTGHKKGVALSYRTIAAQLDSYSEALRITNGDCVVSWLPLYHDMGLVACFLMPAYCGVPFVQLDPFEWVARPALFLDAIEAHRCTLAWMPNFAFAHLAMTVQGPRRDLSSMRAFIDCSEPCRTETLARFSVRFAAWGARPDMLQASYAMAETVFAVTQTPLGIAPRARDGLMNLGRPIDGIEISIRDQDGEPVLEGQFGEIALRGAFMLEGYYRDPALTADRMRDGWFFTRDRGYLIDGELYVSGRFDDLLIVNGRKAHAHEIEASIDALGLTKPGRAAAFTVCDERNGGDALIVVAERKAVTPDGDAVGRITERIGSTFDMQPRVVRVVPPGWVVKTSSGKVSRQDNARKYQAEALADV